MMIRPLVLLGCACFLGTGFHVYSIKAEVDALGAELRRTLQATEAERVRARTLSAEWARLNDQDRLQRLASAHLQELQPTTPQQFVRVADAGRRLPPATPFTGGTSGFRARADAPAMPGEVLVFSARTMLAEAAPPVRMNDAAVDAPLRQASATPAPDAAPPVVAVPVAAAAVEPAPVAATLGTAALAAATRAPAPPAAANPEPVARVAARAPDARATQARPAQPRLAEARPRPAADPSLRTAMHVRAAPVAPVSAPLAPPMAHGGSVLGGGGALPPPMPFATTPFGR